MERTTQMNLAFIHPIPFLPVSQINFPFLKWVFNFTSLSLMPTLYFSQTHATPSITCSYFMVGSFLPFFAFSLHSSSNLFTSFYLLIHFSSTASFCSYWICMYILNQFQDSWFVGSIATCLLSSISSLWYALPNVVGSLVVVLSLFFYLDFISLTTSS